MSRIGGHAMLLVRLGEAYLQVLRVGDAWTAAPGMRSSFPASTRSVASRPTRSIFLESLLRTILPPSTRARADIARLSLRAEELEMGPLLARCYLDLGQLHRRIGRRDNANSHLSAAVSLFRALDMPYWLERAQAHLVVAPQ